jgi:GNAT superfamily N-acetyltransferase
MRDGILAVEDGRAVGFAAVDLAGSIPLVLVTPGHQRRGIGAGPLGAALGRLRAAAVTGRWPAARSLPRDGVHAGPR